MTFALIDANSFYCACERIFDPALRQRPVIVLSNGDGCTISRTLEAKRLGIAMGAPFFKIRDFCRKEKIAVRSSNYMLYGDMSRRCNEIYEKFAPVEIYSIDESFLDLSHIKPTDRVALANDLRTTVHQWTDIPTCVGVGPTKTLAKLANHVAKHNPELNGVCDLTDLTYRAKIMASTSVSKVWGIGPALAARLGNLGVFTAADLSAMDHRLARQALTVVGGRTVLELCGVPCTDFQEVEPQRKGCAVTRNLSNKVMDIDTMLEAIAAHTVRLSEKLRQSRLETSNLTVFFRTARHDTGPHKSLQITIELPEATNNTLVLVGAAKGGARAVWQDGFRYSKAGVISSDLVSMDHTQRSMFDSVYRARSVALMEAIDRINRRYGRDSIYPAAAGIKREWSTKFTMRSPAYTTRIDEAPIVKNAVIFPIQKEAVGESVINLRVFE